MLHEFTHKLDLANGTFDGTPGLVRDSLDEWVRVCTPICVDLQAGIPGPRLRPYAAVNPVESVAVATEVFFELPLQLPDAEPDLSRVLGHGKSRGAEHVLST